MESATIEHPKSVTKLSNSNIITQQINKIYAELKAADCRLQLDVIKRHIPPKNCSQRYEIKF